MFNEKFNRNEKKNGNRPIHIIMTKHRRNSVKSIRMYDRDLESKGKYSVNVGIYRNSLCTYIHTADLADRNVTETKKAIIGLSQGGSRS